MSHLQHPRGPWDGLTPMPRRRRRFPRSRIHPGTGPHLRERMAISWFEVSVSLFVLVLIYLLGVFWWAEGATLSERSLKASGLPIVFLASNLASWASRAIPFFYRNHLARLPLIGLPAFLLGFYLLGEIIG